MTDRELPRFGALLRHHRLAAGWTQEELAERAGMSVQAIGSLERGARRAPRPATLRELAAALDLSGEERATFFAAVHGDTRVNPLSDDHNPLLSPQVIPTYPLPAHGPLVGRAEELRRITDSLDRILSLEGQGTQSGETVRLIAIGAEAGLGKTRLLAEVTQRARRDGILTLAGGCYEMEGRLPYGPVHDALLDYVRALPVAVLNSQLKELLPHLSRIIPELGDSEAGAPELSADAQNQRLRLFTAVAQSLERLSQPRPVLFIIDDLHWADEATLQLLHFLQRRSSLAKVILLVAYRSDEVGEDDPLDRFLRSLQRSPEARKLALHPLDELDLAALLSSHLRGTADSSLVRRLYERSAGNPLLALQLLQLLQEEGRLESSPAGWRVRSDDGLELPPVVRDVIMQRVRRLAADEREVLALGAVLGRDFPHATLQEVWGGEPSLLEHALQHAADLHIVTDSATGYTFQHPLLWEVVYGRIPARRRAVMHSQVAKALVRRYGDRATEHAAELAHHFLAAGAEYLREAVRYLLAAGDRAEEAFAHQEAVSSYSLALEHARALGDQKAQTESLEKLGTVLSTIGHYAAALSLLDEAVRLARMAGDRGTEARVVVGIGRTHLSQGTTRDGLAVVQSAINTREGSDASSDLASLYTIQAHLLSKVGAHAEQVEVAGRAIALARAAGNDSIRGDAEGARANGLWLLGRYLNSVDAARDGVRRTEMLGDPVALADALRNAGQTCLREGQLHESREHFERAVALLQQTGDVPELIFVLSCLGFVLVVMGDWQEARARMEEVQRIERRLPGAAMAVAPLMDLGLLSLHEGDWKAAAHWLQEALAVAEQSGDLFAVRLTQNRLAIVDIHEGRPHAAISRLTPLLDRPSLKEFIVTPLLPTLAWAYLELGDDLRAEAIAREAVTRAREHRTHVELVEAMRIHARALARQQRWKEVEGILDEILALTRAMPFPYAEAQALEAHALMLQAHGELDLAHGLLEEALGIFQRLGARKDIERITCVELQGKL